ncbi:MAG: hypothetical protein L0229_04525 [Blastocatellia bacterium]|nr:hypothetical protein [Blastocatellia bacterium]
MSSYSALEPVHSPVVSALFKYRESAEQAYKVLLDLGYSRDEITILMSDEARTRYFPANKALETEFGTKAAEGAGIGGGIGVSVGALAAALLAIGTTVTLPGLGLVVAGPLAAGLAGAGAGGVAGGLIGALIGSRIPEERARLYERGIREGGIWLSVVTRSRSDAEEIEGKWHNLGAEHIHR